VRDGDPAGDGVCVLFIATKLGVAQPTAAAHVQALARAGAGHLQADQPVDLLQA